MSDEFTTDGDLLGVLEKLRPGESIDADGIARTLNKPHLNTSIGFRMYYLINQGFAAYADGNSQKWYVAGQKLKEKKT